MKIIKCESTTEDIFNKLQAHQFRLSTDFSYLALTFNRKITVFSFNYQTSISIQLNDNILGIDFIENMLMIHLENKQVWLYQIISIQKEGLQLIKFEIKIAADQYYVDQNRKILIVFNQAHPTILTLYKLRNLSIIKKNEVPSQIEQKFQIPYDLKKPKIFIHHQHYLFEACFTNKTDIDLVHISFDDFKIQCVSIVSKYQNIIYAFRSKIGMVFLIDNSLNIEIFKQKISQGIEIRLNKLIGCEQSTNKKFVYKQNENILIVAIDNLQKKLNSIFLVYLNDYEHPINPFLIKVQFIKIIKQIKLPITQIVDHFQYSRSHVQETIMILNNNKIKLIKNGQEFIQQDFISSSNFVNPSHIESKNNIFKKPTKILQKSSKAIKNSVEPQISNSGFNSMIFLQKSNPSQINIPEFNIFENKQIFSEKILKNNRQKKEVMKQQIKNQIKQIESIKKVQKPQKVQEVQKIKKVQKVQKFQKVQKKEQPEKNISRVEILDKFFEKKISEIQKSLKLTLENQTVKFQQNMSKIQYDLKTQLQQHTIKIVKSEITKYVNQELTDKLEKYFQQIFKKISQTYQLGAKYCEQQQKNNSKKIQAINQNSILTNIKNFQIMVTQIKSSYNDEKKSQKQIELLLQKSTEWISQIHTKVNKLVVNYNEDVKKHESIDKKLQKKLEQIKTMLQFQESSELEEDGDTSGQQEQIEKKTKKVIIRKKK